MSKAPSLGLAALFVLVGACGGAPAEPATPSSPAAAGAPAHGATPAATPAAATPSAERPYTVIVTADRVKAMMGDAKTVVVDVRSPEDYAKGHIPGAINLHGELWRTPSAKGGKPSHDLFTKADGSIDTAKYDALLGGAGIANDSKVVVYGNHVPIICLCIEAFICVDTRQAIQLVISISTYTYTSFLGCFIFCSCLLFSKNFFALYCFKGINFFLFN